MEMNEGSVASVELECETYQEDLLLDWILSTEEIKFISESSRGDNNRLYFALQYKHLQLEGVFIEKIESFSQKIISALVQQLELECSGFKKAHRNSRSKYQKEISNYLGYRECTQLDYNKLEQFVSEEMNNDFLRENELKYKVYEWMKGLKLLQPPEYNFNRKLKSFRLNALDSLYLKISDKLAAEQKEQVLFLLERKPNLFTQINYYKKSPPEPTAAKINEFISRYNELDDIGITQIDLSDITESTFNKLEVLGRTYDSNALSQVQATNKKLALILCMLFSASKTLLDHILEMNDQLLLKKERTSRNSFNKNMKDANRQAKKGLKLLVKTTRSWLEHQAPEKITLLDFKETIDENKLVNAIVACEKLSDYQTSGYYAILENKYNDLRKYMPNFFNLPFEGAVGMEPVIKSIQIGLRDIRGRFVTFRTNHHLRLVSSLPISA